MPEKGRRNGRNGDRGAAPPRGGDAPQPEPGARFPLADEPAKKGDPPIEWARDAPRSRNGRGPRER